MEYVENVRNEDWLTVSKMDSKADSQGTHTNGQ